MRKKLGIIGGMGPWATSYIFEKIIDTVDADTDQDHIHTFIDSNTEITDRTKAITEGATSPVAEINRSIEKLEQCGASVFILPCNTSHYFFEDFKCSKSSIIINIIEVTVKACMDMDKSGKFCILATNGTIDSELYQKCFDSHKLNYTIPDKDFQQAIMDMIYKVIKNGGDYNKLDGLTEFFELQIKNGAGYFVLGCTELSMLMQRPAFKKYRMIDSSLELAKSAIIECGYPMKS